MGPEQLAEVLEPRPLDLEAGRGAVPAVTGEGALAGAQAGQEVEPRHAAPRAPAPGAVEGDQHGGPKEPLGQARGADSDHARVPALAPEHDRRGLLPTRAEAGQGALGVGQDLGLGLAALLVQAVELGRDQRRPVLVVGQEQLDGAVGAVEPTGRVDPRRQAESQGARVQPLRGHTGDGHQRPQPGTGAAARLLEPAPDQRAVLAGQWNHVGDGRQRDEVEVALGPLGAGERSGELVGHARGTEVLVGIAGDDGMDDRAVGQLLARLMVIGDDCGDSLRPGRSDLRHRVDPAVHRDHEARAALGEALDRGGRQPVAVLGARGDQPVAISAQLAQGRDQDRSRGDTVDVVVAVHGDELAARDRIPDHRHRLADAGEEGWVVGVGGREERPRLLGRAASPPHERDGDRLGQAELTHQPRRLVVAERGERELGWHAAAAWTHRPKLGTAADGISPWISAGRRRVRRGRRPRT